MHTIQASYTIILLTLLMAMLLTLLPLPLFWQWLQPAWVLLVLIYWGMTLPQQQVSVGMAWIVGLIIDLLTGTLLGQHAFAYTMVIYCVEQFRINLQLYSLLQQSMSIMILVSVYQFILYCIQGFIGVLPHPSLYGLTIISSTLLWPWLVMLLRICLPT